MSAIAIDAEDMAAAASAGLAALVRSRSREIDAAARLPNDIAAALRASPLLRLLMPHELGSIPGSWAAAFDAIETVACADSATGWSLMIGMTINMLTGYITKHEAVRAFGNGAPLFSAGVFEPRGIGRVAEGDGFLVSGKWRFATGIHLSDWFCATASVTEGSTQNVRHFFIPSSSLAIHPNWDVVGLRGTASDEVECHSIRVDRAMSFKLDDHPWPDEPLWHVSFYTVTALLMAAAVLGMTQNGLTSVASKGRGRATQLTKFSGSPSHERDLATAEAIVGAGRAFVLDRMHAIDECIMKGQPPPEKVRAHLWLAAIHTVQTCGEALDLLFSGEGASGIYHESTLQRCWRDVRVAGKHVVVARQRLEQIGHVLMGAPADARPFL